MNPFLHGRIIVGDWQGSQNLFGPLSCKLVKLHDGAGGPHGSQKQLLVNCDHNSSRGIEGELWEVIFGIGGSDQDRIAV
jgi:hypothetical protein